jgi:hypothetical protein
MKYIKTFEMLETATTYIYNNDLFMNNDVFDYLVVQHDFSTFDENYVPKSIYDVNVIDFFKEILLNKYVIFFSLSKPENNAEVKGVIKDVGSFAYKDDFYIRVKLDNWHIMHNTTMTAIYDYDADTKPLHKEVKLKKYAEKYNI